MRAPRRARRAKRPDQRAKPTDTRTPQAGGAQGGRKTVEPSRLPELSVEPSVEWGADVAAAARQCSQGSELACYALGKPLNT